ncbi:unnamed protein product [Protopolystoma xenopodis]|uniref:Uncharacterized protein n=1 Tax=Protopolystoma xenopodis TaxID=117903 RepID=A0A448X004_9PLAT|nr:unnamed protein product [Protopolystoma xenopodis]
MHTINQTIVNTRTDRHNQLDNRTSGQKHKHQDTNVASQFDGDLCKQTPRHLINRTPSYPNRRVLFHCGIDKTPRQVPSPFQISTSILNWAAVAGRMVTESRHNEETRMTISGGQTDRRTDGQTDERFTVSHCSSSPGTTGTCRTGWAGGSTQTGHLGS